MENPTSIGRPRTYSIRKYFVYKSEDQYSYCQIENCSARIKGDHSGNLEKHIKTQHMDHYALISQEKNRTYSGKRERSESLAISMSIEKMKNACIELVTVNGRPLTVVDDSGFRKILNMLLEALGVDTMFTISSSNIREMVISKAAEIRSSIRQDVMGKLISLKVDAATRHDRGFLGINVQFIENGIIQIRTLGIIELVGNISSEYLKKVLHKVLREYEINVANIYSLTCDNVNMLKLRKLIKEEPPAIEELKEENESTEQNDDEDIADSEGEEPGDDEDHEDYAEALFYDEQLNQPDFCSLTDGSTIISNIRCAAHALQLAIDDALKKIEGTERTIAIARRVAKALRTPKIRRELLRSKPDSKKTKLNTARWNSSVDMLQSVMDVKDFCEEFSPKYKSLSLTEQQWELIEEYLKSLTPAKIATRRLRSEQLALGSLFGIWMECKFETCEISTLLAREIVKAMEEREELLMQNEALLASVYLDPRFLPLLPRECYPIAITKLEEVWQKLEQLNGSRIKLVNYSSIEVAQKPEDENSINSIQTNFQSDSFRKLWNKAIADRATKPQLKSNIRQILYDYEDSIILDPSMDILQWWETKKYEMPQLYRLAMVVHAAPGTQVSVERLFSGLQYIFSPLTANLKGQLLHDILVVRCDNMNSKNHDAFSKRNRRYQRKRTENNSSLSELSNGNIAIHSLAPGAMETDFDGCNLIFSESSTN